jgi:hypothetical protein
MSQRLGKMFRYFYLGGQMILSANPRTLVQWLAYRMLNQVFATAPFDECSAGFDYESAAAT